jgi:GNAT superfamily N-acetyltransferase
MKLKIVYLKDYPQYQTEAAELLMNFWGTRYPDRSLEDWGKKLYPNKDKIPFTLIAIDESYNPAKLVGMVSLCKEKYPFYPEEGVWLSALFVKESERGKGIAINLTQETIRAAEQLKISNILLFTRTDGALYKKLGWTLTKTIEYQGSPTLLMERKIFLSDSYYQSNVKSLYWHTTDEKKDDDLEPFQFPSAKL